MKPLFCIFSLFFALQSLGQNSLRFIVSNEEGELLVGASIIYSETNTGGVTDSEGYFEFTNLPDGKSGINGLRAKCVQTKKGHNH